VAESSGVPEQDETEKDRRSEGPANPGRLVHLILDGGVAQLARARVS
jgi:hypothetical protein